MAALLGAKKVARTANLQVAHGNLKATAKRRVLLNRAEPFAHIREQAGVAWQQQIRVRLVLIAAHPAAQLVQIAQPKPVGTINDNRVRVGDIETAFDDRRRKRSRYRSEEHTPE